MNKYPRSPEYEPSINPTLFFLCGASAVGKTTLATHVVGLFNQLGIQAKLPVCHTTRDKRRGEVAGVDYNFVRPECFRLNYSRLIAASPDEWDVDRYGAHVYFSRYSDTIPNAACPISVLPISLDSCEGMVEKYQSRYPDINIRVISILLKESNVDAWRVRMSALRPSRNVPGELEENYAFSPPDGIAHASIAPTWHLKQDVQQVMGSLSLSLGA